MQIAKTLKENMINIEHFINHNLQNGNINENSTVKELLQFINMTKEQYIPLYEEVEKYISRNNI